VKKEIRCKIKQRDSIHKETGGVIYDYVCYDPETGFEYSRIPITSQRDLEKVCAEDNECKVRYLGLLVRLIIEKDERAWTELKKFHEERRR
jgi:hypothetical protein